MSTDIKIGIQWFSKDLQKKRSCLNLGKPTSHPLHEVNEWSHEKI
jgi:hypothetical protein